MFDIRIFYVIFVTNSVILEKNVSKAIKKPTHCSQKLISAILDQNQVQVFVILDKLEQKALKSVDFLDLCAKFDPN